SDGEGQYAAKLGAWAGAILYVANANLIFMQATAMGEALYLAFFIWAVAFFAEFVCGNPKALTRCGLCLAAACLTRYDGWFLAGVLVLAAIAFHLRKESKNDPAAAAPVLWLAYNAAVYRNPLEFANGPYSAKAIEQKTATVNPAKGNLLAAGSYFLKAAELDVGESSWMGRLWLALALLGSLAALLSRRTRAALFLWLPLPFYALSVAYGSVPIFVPPWWP